MTMPREHIQFVTGRLAEHSLRQIVEPLAREVGFDYTIDVLPITVAALMTPEWIARRINVPPARRAFSCPAIARATWRRSKRPPACRSSAGRATCGSCPSSSAASRRRPTTARTTSKSSPRSTTARGCTLAEIRAQARQLAADGADVIDVGCEPDGPWAGVAEAVRALRDDGHRVSIDSLDPREIEPAVRAGAELVLSVNSSNRDGGPRLGLRSGRRAGRSAHAGRAR